MTRGTIEIRAMGRRDLPDVARIQTASPEASHWNPEDYLGYESFVAEYDGMVGGFAVARLLPPDEIEVLNVCTDPELRRRGIGGALVRALLSLRGTILFLEVRESNSAARALYARVGFVENGRRKNYYASLGEGAAPREDAVVMKMQK